MARYRVDFRTAGFGTYFVEADSESEALDAVYARRASGSGYDRHVEWNSELDGIFEVKP